MYYLYTFINHSDMLALAYIYFIYLASIDSLHLSSINHIDVYTSFDYEYSNANNNMNLAVEYF